MSSRQTLFICRHYVPHRFFQSFATSTRTVTYANAANRRISRKVLRYIPTFSAPRSHCVIDVFTGNGMDFLADDGGLSAVLDAVTVKLHENTLKKLIANRISESDLPASEKSQLLDQIK